MSSGSWEMGVLVPWVFFTIYIPATENVFKPLFQDP